MNTADLLGSRGLLNSGMAAIADAVNVWTRNQAADRAEKRRQDLLLREEARQAKLDQAQESNRRLQILLQHGIDINDPNYLQIAQERKREELEKKNAEQAAEMADKKRRAMADLFHLGTQGADLFQDTMSTPNIDELARGASLIPTFTPDQSPEARINRKGLEIFRKSSDIADKERKLEAEKLRAYIEKLTAEANATNTKAAGNSAGSKKEKPGNALRGLQDVAKTFDQKLGDEDGDAAAMQKMLQALRKIKQAGGNLNADQEEALQYLELWEQEQAKVVSGTEGKPGTVGKMLDVGGTIAGPTAQTMALGKGAKTGFDMVKSVAQTAKNEGLLGALADAAKLKPTPAAPVVKQVAKQGLKTGAVALAKGAGTLVSKAALPVSVALGIADVARYYGGDGETVSGTPELLAALLSAEGPDDRLKWVRGEEVPEYAMWANAVRNGVPMDKKYKTDFDRGIKKINDETREPETRLVRLENLIQVLKKNAAVGSK